MNLRIYDEEIIVYTHKMDQKTQMLLFIKELPYMCPNNLRVLSVQEVLVLFI